MSNSVKFSNTVENRSLKSGDFYLGTGDVSKGPTNETGFYNSIIPPEGGYTIYLKKEANGPSIYLCEDDFSLINLTNLIFNLNLTSIEECLDHYKNDVNSFCANRDYEPTITKGLIVNLDAGFSGSLRPNSNLWKNLSGDNSAILSGGYKINNIKGGNISFDGVDGMASLDIGYISNIKNFSLWFRPNVEIQSEMTLISSESFKVSILPSSLLININQFTESIQYTFNEDRWYFISVSNIDNNYDVYINDELFSFSSTELINCRYLNIASNATTENVSNFFNGNITNIMIYDEPLSRYEVLFNYNNHSERTIFESIWNTENISEGSSNSNQINLPLISTGNYDMVVDWGDGSSDSINSFDDPLRLHTYQNPGIYTIKISGRCDGFRFNDSGDKLKILEIKNWGILKIISDSAFFGCVNLDIKSIDSPEIKTKNISSLFKGCDNLKGNNSLNKWDVDEVEIADEAFSETSLKVSLESWKPKSANSLRSIFKNSKLNSEKYTRTLSKWVEVISDVIEEKSEQGIELIVDLSGQEGMVFAKDAQVIAPKFESTELVREYIESSTSLILSGDTVVLESSRFLLSNGIWNDSGVWDDDAFWQD